jgi:hypothetical protein
MKIIADTLSELEFQVIIQLQFSYNSHKFSYNLVIIHIISYNSEPEQAHTQFSYNSHIEAHIYNYIAHAHTHIYIMFMHYIMYISSSLVHIS